MKIWIGRNGESYGPFSTNTTQRFLEEGKLKNDDLAWDLENQEWIELENLLTRVEGQGKAGLTEKEQTPESKADKIRELINSKNEELALDLLLGDSCPKVFANLAGSLLSWRIGEARELECHSRFEFELLANLPPGTDLPDKFATHEIKLLGLRSSWIVRPSDISRFSNLGTLNLTLDEEFDFTELVKLRELKTLTITCLGFDFTDLSILSPLEKLEEITVKNAKNLVSIEPLTERTSLLTLRLIGCPGIESLAPLASCSLLREIDLSGSGSELADAKVLGKLVELEKVSLSGWKKLETLEGLESLHNLQEIDLSGCRSIKRLDPLYNLKFLELVKGSLPIKWSADAFSFMVETKADLTAFRDQVEEQEDGPELLEEMLSCFSTLNPKAVESMSYDSFDDLVYFAFSCAERFNLKRWYTEGRGELSRQAYWFLADCAGASVRKLLRVADFNNGQYYCDQTLARSCIDRAIEAFEDATKDEEILGHFIRACTENGMYPDAIPLFCAKMNSLNLDEYAWDLREWPEEFEFDGYTLPFPSLSAFGNLEELSTNGLSILPSELDELKKLKRLEAWSFRGETLELPESMACLEEIELESSEELKTLGDLSVFRSLKWVNLAGCDQLERPDWLSKIDHGVVEINLPDHLLEASN